VYYRPTYVGFFDAYFYRVIELCLRPSLTVCLCRDSVCYTEADIISGSADTSRYADVPGISSFTLTTYSLPDVNILGVRTYTI